MPAVFAEEFLDPEEAFQLSAASTSPTEVDLHFKIAPEYYMYEERFQFELSGDEVQLGDVVFPPAVVVYDPTLDRKSTRLNSSHVAISYAVFCLKKKKNPLVADRGYDPSHAQRN